MWNWIKKHPQRIAGLGVVMFSQIQAGFAMLQTPIHPLITWGVNSTLGLIIATLAWAIKNLKDEDSTQEIK